ncbi:MAG: hypothetical protein U0931_27395 [Vulcanimicrobiota bacterium]
MKLEPVLRNTPPRPPLPRQPQPAGGSAPADRVELSSGPGGPPSPPNPESGWRVCLHNTLQQLASPVGPVVKAVLDVWMARQRESHFESVREFGSEVSAARQFEKSRARLLNPNQWKDLGPGLAAADFKLYCADRRQAKAGPAEVGDFLKIRLPDLGPRVWCRVEKLEQTADSFELVVRPSPDPRQNDPEVAHFFSEETTNHFVLSRQGNKVISKVIGRAESLNQSGHWGDRLVSALRLKGAWLGAKKPQWRSFTRKLLED